MRLAEAHFHFSPAMGATAPFGPGCSPGCGSGWGSGFSHLINPTLYSSCGNFALFVVVVVAFLARRQLFGNLTTIFGYANLQLFEPGQTRCHSTDSRRPVCHLHASGCHLPSTPHWLRLLRSTRFPTWLLPTPPFRVCLRLSPTSSALSDTPLTSPTFFCLLLLLCATGCSFWLLLTTATPS